MLAGSIQFSNSSNWAYLPGGFKHFHPYLGEWSNLTHIFQMGWNHQLDMICFLNACSTIIHKIHATPGFARLKRAGDHLHHLERYPLATETTLSTKLETRGVKFWGREGGDEADAAYEAIWFFLCMSFFGCEFVDSKCCAINFCLGNKRTHDTVNNFCVLVWLFGAWVAVCFSYGFFDDYSQFHDAMTQEILTVIQSPHPHLIGYMEMA